jgi:hypothetical protein
VSAVRGSDGTLFFTDFCSVKKIGTDGLVFTIVGPPGRQECGYAGDGGPGTNALLAPEQDVLKVDNNNNVYIADLFNNRVRRWDAATSIVTTIASLPSPSDVAFDPHGALCIVSQELFTVSCMDTHGTLHTVAGGGTAFPGNGGAAVAASLGPYRIAFDRTNNLYIAEYVSIGMIRRVDTAGVLFTVAGVAGQPGFSGDGGAALDAHIQYGAGLAIDEQGNVLFFDGENRRIRIVKMAATRGPSGPPTASATVTGSLANLTLSVLVSPPAGVVASPGSVFLAALLPAELGGALFLMNAAGGWSPFDGCQAAPAAFTGTLASAMTVPVVRTATDLTAFRGTALYVGYGVGATPEAACTSMLNRATYIGSPVYTLQ